MIHLLTRKIIQTIDLFINNIFLNREKIFTRVRDFILNNNKYLLNKKNKHIKEF